MTLRNPTALRQFKTTRNARRTRPLVLEILEIRTVLAFTHSFADGELTLVGEADVDDHLLRIYAIVPSGFVKYD